MGFRGPSTSGSHRLDGTKGEPGNLQGSGSATVISGDTVVTGHSRGDQEQGGISVTPGSEGQMPTSVSDQLPDTPAITYKDANKLTWVVNGTRVELLSNLSVEELQSIAEGLIISD